MVLNNRVNETGLRRYCSPFLLSAFFVLLGGFLILYESTGALSRADLRFVFTSQIAYGLSLLISIAFLYRAKRNIEESMLLLFILGLLILDGLGVQHLYGWVDVDGKWSAATGGASGVLLALGASAALRLPFGNRLTLTAIAAVLFIRCGGFLLVPAAPQTGRVTLSPAHAWLGWLLAACLLPIFIGRGLGRARPDLPERKLERYGLSLCLAVAVGHFLFVGESLDLPLRLAYLSPFVILLPAAVEHVAKGVRARRWARICLDGCPYVGLALAASYVGVHPSLLGMSWSNRFPITPFWLGLLLAVPVSLLRARYSKESDKAYSAAAFAALACLGFDLPEVLACMVYPTLWQAAAVIVVCWAAIGIQPRLKSALILHALPAFVAAGFLAGKGYPFIPGFLLLLTWGVVVLDRLCVIGFRLRARVALLLFLALGPAFVLAFDHGSPVRFGFAALTVPALALLGRLWRDRLPYLAAALSAPASLGVEFVTVQRAGEISLGRLFIEAGFLILLFSLLNTIIGERMKNRIGSWWVKIKEESPETDL
jgi:hypothetical protein